MSDNQSLPPGAARILDALRVKFAGQTHFAGQPLTEDVLTEIAKLGDSILTTPLRILPHVGATHQFDKGLGRYQRITLTPF